MDGNLSINKKGKYTSLPFVLHLIIVDTVASFLAHANTNVPFELILLILVSLWFLTVLGHFYKGRCLSYRLHKDDFLQILLAVLLNMLLFSMTLNWISGVSLSTIDNFKMNMFSLLLAIFIGPITEEIIFRGIIANHFKSEVLNSLISSLAFALLHGSTSLVALILYTVFGLSSFYLYRKSGNLVNSILFHILLNLSSLLLFLIC